MPRVPRPKSTNDTQLTVNLPGGWVDELERVAELLSRPGLPPITRTDALRLAVRRGLDALAAETKHKAPGEHPETKRRRGG
jgi:hypothetical protein